MIYCGETFCPFVVSFSNSTGGFFRINRELPSIDALEVDIVPVEVGCNTILVAKSTAIQASMTA